MSSLGSIVADLAECLGRLEEAGASLAQAKTSCEELLDACRELEIEQTAALIEVLIEAVQALAEAMDQAKSSAAEIIVQVEALGQRSGTGSGSSGIGPQPGDQAGGQPKLTTPSRPVDPAAMPEGEPEEVHSRDRPIKQESIRQQNQAAKVLAEQGYQIEQLPRVHDRKSPDFLIEGRIFDCYSPRSDTGLDGIRSKLRQKVQKKQADRFVVNLDQSQFSEADLRQHLSRTAPGGLREVLVVKDGIVSRVWP
jgi:chemotaxis protein histidine kinase CheA